MEHAIKLGKKKATYGSGPFRIPIADLALHMIVSGKSGTGKSTFLANIFAQLANQGQAVILIDPHGDLANQVLDLIPPRRINKTIYINPGDMAWSVGFNPLDGVHPDRRAARASEIVNAFRSIWGHSWGPRLEQILLQTLAALLEMENATLLGIQRMMLNKSYRDAVVRNIKDPLIAQFWTLEFPIYAKKQGSNDDPTASVLNKIGQVLASPAIRNMLGQKTSSFDLRHVMDNNYVVVVDLSKGALGPDHANLFGSLLVSCIGSAAMSRDDIPHEQRKQVALIIDEFPNYMTTSFADLLAEARKYRLSLTLAHQHLAQIPEKVRDAVIGNCGSTVAFRVGATDAEHFSREFDGLEPHNVTDTPNHHAWCRIMQFGEPSEPFLLQTLRPPQPHGNRDKVISNSRIHFATPRAKIEAFIAWFVTGGASDQRPGATPKPLSQQRTPPTNTPLPPTPKTEPKQSHDFSWGQW